MGFLAGRVGGADAGKTVPVVAASRGGGIEGTVKDERGRPIAGARVENPKNKTNPARKTRTDKNGHYALDDLNESPLGFRVLVQAPGRCPVQKEVQPGPSGKPARVDFTLAPGHVLHGRVVDENGRPISGVSVETLVAWSREPANPSDKDGRFEIDSLPANANFSISKPGYSRLWWVPLRLDSAGLVTVVLQPMGVIRGRVVDGQSGKPLEHFTVWLNKPRTAGPSSIQAGYGREFIYPGKTFASSDGTFTISDLTNKGAAEISVAADGHRKCVKPVVVAKTLNEATPLEFALPPIDRAKLATYSGRVLDARGQPVSGTNLRLMITSIPPGGPDDLDFRWNVTTRGEIAGRWYCDQFLNAVSDSEGRFEFKGVLPDEHWLLAYWGPGVPQDRVVGTSKTAPGPAPSLTIKVSPSARVIVTIDRAKYPKAWQLGTLLRGSHIETTQIELHSGQTKVEIRDLMPGDYNLHIFARPALKDGAVDIEVIATKRVQLKPGETKEVRF